MSHKSMQGTDIARPTVDALNTASKRARKPSTAISRFAMYGWVTMLDLLEGAGT